MANKLKQKRRLRKSLVQRQKEISKIAFDKAWLNYWKNVGILRS